MDEQPLWEIVGVVANRDPFIDVFEHVDLHECYYCHATHNWVQLQEPCHKPDCLYLKARQIVEQKADEQ